MSKIRHRASASLRDLKHYRAKRDPSRTPEPFGAEASPRALAPGAPRRFVVQQHAARSLHWDLRLEIEGVLVSFAVPRGPSLDPQQKRLAVQTEDHPLEYADFEGVIPACNYGAGAMIVWDSGTYRSVDGVAPADGLAKGKLDLALEGHKLRGRFALVRTGGKAKPGREWLLFTKERGFEAPDIVERAPESVFSGLAVRELAAGITRDAEVSALAEAAGAKRASVDAARLRPMLASTGERAFSREGWLFELKYDGVRAIAEAGVSRARLFARTGGERTHLYPELTAALAHLPVREVVLDGEIVALDERGRASFERIQRRFTQATAADAELLRREVPVVYYAFDCLATDGFDLRKLPLEKRKQILAALIPPRGPLRLADHVAGDGVALFDAVRAHGMEGVIAKQASSTYEAGERSKRWIKLKVPRADCFVVVGVSPGQGSRKQLGSLMLAGWRDGKLAYVGNAGSGLTARQLEVLLPELEKRRRAKPACVGLPELLPRGTWFVAPELVAEVRFSEATSAGMLRHPVFLALRDDIAPAACSAPALAASEPAAVAAPQQLREAEFKPTRLDKVFWPVEGYTKGDLLAYYERVWPWLAPYLRDRPVVLTRYPDGIEGKSFYQKNAPEFTPDWARRETIDGTDYFVCNDLRTLLYVINSGAIPLHVWSARLTNIERPDWLILDLDPKEAPFAHVIEIARLLHALFREIGVAHFVKTSGQAGMHVLLPLAQRLTHDEAKNVAEAVARVVVAERPDIATVTRPVAARGDKVYVDFLQNGRGKLIAAPLSVRPRPKAPVSMPLSWAPVNARLDPARWNIASAEPRLAKHGDPLAGVLGAGIDPEALLAGLIQHLGRSAEKT
ncbi:MAG: DNA ligase D [Deltaproteobacteria bacterium]|nr:DNA ligase D [Deltaproteobacteria bacterium]